MNPAQDKDSTYSQNHVTATTYTHLLSDLQKDPLKYLELAAVIIIVISAEQKIVYINKKGCEILGYKKDELLGKNWFETCIPKENQDEIKNVFEQLVQGSIEPVKFYENEVVTKEEKKKMISWHNTILRDKKGDIIGTISSGTDITEKAKEGEVIKKSEKKYRELFANMINGFAYHKMIWDTNGKPKDYTFLEINDAFEDLTGLKRKDIIGKQATKVLPGLEHDPTRWIEKYGQVVKAGEGMRFEAYSQPLDRFYSVYAYSPKKDHFATIFQDITFRKHAEQELKRINRSLRMISDANQKLIRSTKEVQLLNEICTVVVESGEYGAAWIALLERDKKIKPVAQKGLQEEYLKNITIDWTSKDKDPLKTVITKKKPLTIQHTETHEYSSKLLKKCEELGYKSCIALPILFEDTALGIFAVHSKKSKAFDELEKDLLVELADDVGFGLHALRTRKLLQKSEQQFKSIFERAPLGMAMVDKDGKPVMNNQALQDILGYSEKELQNMPFVEFTHPEDAQKDADLYQELIDNKRDVYEMEKRYIRKDNKVIWADLTVSAVRDKHGKMIYAVGMVHDISKEKKSRLKLKKEKQKAQQYLDIAHVMFIALDAEGNVTLINNKGSEILEYTAEEVLGKNWFETCIPKKVRKDVKDVFKQLIKGEVEPVEFYENEVVTKSGNKRLISWHNTVQKNPEGNIIGIIGSGTDITDQRKLETELKMSKQKYQELYEKAPVMLASIEERTQKIIECNKAFIAKTGYEKEELINSNIRDIIHPDSTKKYEQTIETLKEADEIKNIELSIIQKNSSKINILLNATTVKDDVGNITHYRFVFQDITQLNKVQKALKQSEHRFRELANLLPLTIFEINAEGMITYTNEFGYKTFGYVPEDIKKGIRAIELFDKQDQPRIAQSIEKILNGKAIADQQFLAKKRDGKTFPALIYYNAIMKNGKPHGIRGVIVDISEQLSIQSELKKKVEELERLNNVMVGREIKMIELKKELEKETKKKNNNDEDDKES